MELVLVRYGELGIKGDNKFIFENKLITNIKSVLGKHEVKISKAGGRIYLKVLDEATIDDVMDRVQKVFGIVEVCRACVVDKEIETIKIKALEILKNVLTPGKSFKVATKRGDKDFKLSSIDTSKIVGGYIYDALESEGIDFSVDVHNPDITLSIEIREEVYIYDSVSSIRGNGGMPVGTNGKGLLLLSGGIDSPAAGYMISKRGVEIDAVHFMSPPYTSERAKEKVIELAKIISKFTGKIKMYMVPFTDIQMAIYEKCPENLITIIMRRYMMKLSEHFARECGAECLITGESIGQVASQTIKSLYTTNAVATMPVFRPFIGLDKMEIVEIAKRIGTYETSILPYEDCCTVFVPKHPETKPKLEFVEEVEKNLDDVIEKLLSEAIEKTEIIEI